MNAKLDRAREKVDTRVTLGRLTLMEFLGLLILAAATAYGAWMALALFPLMEEVSKPGSGGTAQMLAAMVFGPVFLYYAVLAIGCPIVFVLVYRSAAARIRRQQIARSKSNQEPPASAN